MSVVETPNVTLDLSELVQTVEVVGIVARANLIKSILDAFPKSLYKRSAVKPVQPFGDGSDLKIVLLNPDIFPTIESITTAANLSKKQRDIVLKANDKVDSFQFANYEVSLDHRSMTSEEILSKLLPKDMQIVSGFEAVGHVAHLNLRDVHLPYKNLIGQVIMLKNPTIKTVVTKLGNIKTKFRTFNMEVIAGEDRTETTVSEAGIRYKLDFRTVYWNSRLSTEHNLMSQSFTSSDIICDMFAGIGPFAIPAAKKLGCTVYANDLNPESFKYLQVNRDLNKIPHDKLHVYNMDGAEFVKHLVANNIKFHHVLMNLPDSAHTFLPVFRELYPRRLQEIQNEEQNSNNSESNNESSTTTDAANNEEDNDNVNRKAKKERKRKKAPPPAPVIPKWAPTTNSLPWIHCYGFSAEADPKKGFLTMCEQSIGCELPTAVVREVRDVSPHKRMILVSFPLPESIAYASDNKRPCPYSESEDPATKKPKHE